MRASLIARAALLMTTLLAACASPSPDLPPGGELCEGDCQCQNGDCPLECVGSECAPSCNSAGLCEVGCNDVERCSVSCNSVETCRVFCEDSARCDVSCNSVGLCQVDCPYPGQCTLTCNSSSCECAGPGCP